MSSRRTWLFVLAVAVAVCASGPTPSRAVAAPSATQTAADRARVELAVRRWEKARARSERLDARARQVSAELDRIVEAQRVTQVRLNTRADAMYRSGGTDLISVLLGAATFQEFAARWDLLVRIGREDARDLARLKVLRAKAERSANSMLDLQAEQAEAADELAEEAAKAKRDLASSQAALTAYLARTSGTRAASPVAKRNPAPKKDPTQQLRGTGSWKTAVASHYGRNFSGRGASGERIGPYSMIVAHKTLPFGTLIEFEYGGKRAVARVADRGPHVAGREFDLGPGVVRVLDFNGVHKVRYRIIQR